ncbi:unnamed protein product, partial [Gadus morhua 'NCC']
MGTLGKLVSSYCRRKLRPNYRNSRSTLKIEISQKKKISHLSLVGGSNPGECVRRVLRSVASIFVWSSYSLRGKKGKMPLLGTAVGSTIK